MTDPRLVSLLHFADSAFPTGGYAHSFGLEHYCQAGIVRDREGLERFLLTQLEGAAGPCDATAAAGALRAIIRGDLEAYRERAADRGLPPPRARRVARIALPALAPVAVPVACPVEARALGATVRCGTVRVALDRDLPAGRTIRIYFERYLREDDSHPITSTVVSIEGGPGYSTTADRAGRFDLWRPVSATRDLVLVDLRGTGGSGALRCAAFSRSTRDYIARAGRCAAELGPARDLYATGRAVEDVELVLRALGATTIDLYGDSYGTYAAQAFALRHAQRLRTLTLDGAYPLPGTDPTFADLAAAVRRGLRLACARRVTCPARRLGVDPVALVTGFSARLRSRPILGSAPNGDGTVTRVSLDEVAFAQVVGATYYHYGVWRDLLAAIVAARRGDTRRSCGLAAEHVVLDAGGDDRPPSPRRPTSLRSSATTTPAVGSATPIGGRAAEAARRFATTRPARSDRCRRRRGRGSSTGRDGLPALAVPGGRRHRGAARCRVPTGADARPERRSGHHHHLRPGRRARAPVPALDVRRSAPTPST